MLFTGQRKAGGIAAKLGRDPTSRPALLVLLIVLDALILVGISGVDTFREIFSLFFDLQQPQA